MWGCPTQNDSTVNATYIFLYITISWNRQQFPPRSSNPVYTALVIAAGGIDYQRKHETVVDPSKAAPVDLEVAEQREEYERAVTELELAARGAYLATDLTA